MRDGGGFFCRQLLVGHGVNCRNGGAIRSRREDLAAVGHLLTHELDRAVEPRSTARSAVRHGVRQVFAVAQDVAGAEGRDDLALGCGHVGRIHRAASIAARGDVGTVHRLGVQVGVRNNDDVMGRALSISDLVEVVEVRDPVVHAVDRHEDGVAVPAPAAAVGVLQRGGIRGGQRADRRQLQRQFPS